MPEAPYKISRIALSSSRPYIIPAVSHINDWILNEPIDRHVSMLSIKRNQLIAICNWFCLQYHPRVYFELQILCQQSRIDMWCTTGPLGNFVDLSIALSYSLSSHSFKCNRNSVPTMLYAIGICCKTQHQQSILQMQLKKNKNLVWFLFVENFLSTAFQRKKETI